MSVRRSDFSSSEFKLSGTGERTKEHLVTLKESRELEFEIIWENLKESQEQF